MNEPDLWHLYRLMFLSRRFEETVKQLWDDGLISGEMHLGIGEEGIAAGVVANMQEGDALALDHRPTPPMIMRGVDPVLILRELLGQEDGLCSGWGGHMHLFAKAQLAASSGIVGASGPAAAGFALAAEHLRPKTLAAAFFGEGALNQGMMMEALNLAVVWKLPVLFVCKDDGWAIATPTSSTQGSSPLQRAQGFGLPAVEVDGMNAGSIWQAARQLMDSIRAGNGPAFLLASCIRPDAHMLGDKLLRLGRGEEKPPMGSLMRSATRLRGDSLPGRVGNLRHLTGLMGQFAADHECAERDPIALTRRVLEDQESRLADLEFEVDQLIEEVTAAALQPYAGRER